ncbi:MAG: protein rep [Candidatus Helarchaeota archaeon]
MFIAFTSYFCAKQKKPYRIEFLYGFSLKEVKQLINIFNPINVYQLKDNTSNNSTGSGADIESWGPGVDLIDKEITLTKKLIINELNREKTEKDIINDYIQQVKYPKQESKYDFRKRIFIYLAKIKKDGSLKVNKVVELTNRVVGLYFCHSRLCPICEYKKNEVFRIQIKNRVKELIENDKNIRFSFMTLTIKDKDLNREKYMFYKKQVSKILAYYKRKGLIRGAVYVQENKIKNDSYHLHYHILLAGAKYIKKSLISEK